MLAKTLLDRHYRDTPELAHAIADVLAEQVQHLDADVVQLDEANLPGHPEEWEWAAAAINRVLDAVKTTPAVHLCFGNYGGQSVQHGTWEHLMRYLNALHADHVVLECAHRPLRGARGLQGPEAGIGFGLGVIDIKANEVESADEVARAIERAEADARRRPRRYIHPDCGFWMLKRPIADAKIRALAKGRDLFEGELLGGVRAPIGEWTWRSRLHGRELMTRVGFDDAKAAGLRGLRFENAWSLRPRSPAAFAALRRLGPTVRRMTPGLPCCCK